MSRPIPQTSVGRLVSLSVDNPKYYTQGLPSSPPPPLIPIVAAVSASAVAANDDSEERTMLWRNVANLFAKYDNIENELERQRDANRCTDEVYQELQDVKDEIAQVQTEFNENNVLTKHVQKLRKYVNKKCEKMRESVSYSSYDADNEIFAYIDKIRIESDTKTSSMQEEITRLNSEMEELNETYNRDYDLFIQREDDLMAKLDAALKMNEVTNNRMKDMEELFMKQIQQARNYADTRVACDLREEFTTAICRELTFESKVSAQLVQGVNDDLTGVITRSNDATNLRIKYLEDFLMNQIQQSRNYAATEVAECLREEFSGAICREVAESNVNAQQLVQSVNDELTDLITRSNEYHSARYFGTVEDVNQLRDTCQTLKQSIGMVDAELSDTKETVEYLKDEVGQTVTDVSNITEEVNELKDDVYRELDRDYYDLKGYVKRKVNQHKKQHHKPQVSPVQVCNTSSSSDPIQMIVDEYAEPDTTTTATATATATVPDPVEEQQTENDEHVIIIDENTIISDDEDIEVQHT